MIGPSVDRGLDGALWGFAAETGLVGDPSKPGEPDVFRAKLPDGYSVPPHWHSMDGRPGMWWLFLMGVLA